MEPLDLHSFTDSHHPLTTDISLFLFLDFPSATIYAIAFFILKSPYVGQLSFDTRSLSIHQVLSPITLSPLPFSLSSSADPIKGTQLSISLPDDDVLNSFFIVFSTSPSSSALQWLSPLQMFNKKTPFCLYPMPVYPRAFHFPMSRHSRGENPLLCFAQCPSKVIRRYVRPPCR
ncbi:hypothetical protein E1A91_D04G101700v1 [Gossypium mustelinum]|uniref:Uncharacterized protein n=1 Tax=Gossypium mustelinum TaxID=34275 RepID=A0A5D2VC48_GOSMU|nr:hypothetical protein E1A91_D04G101700v1 [Gossypium mustelinum]